MCLNMWTDLVVVLAVQSLLTGYRNTSTYINEATNSPLSIWQRLFWDATAPPLDLTSFSLFTALYRIFGSLSCRLAFPNVTCHYGSCRTRIRLRSRYSDQAVTAGSICPAYHHVPLVNCTTKRKKNKTQRQKKEKKKQNEIR